MAYYTKPDRSTQQAIKIQIEQPSDVIENLNDGFKNLEDALENYTPASTGVFSKYYSSGILEYYDLLGDLTDTTAPFKLELPHGFNEVPAIVTVTLVCNDCETPLLSEAVIYTLFSSSGCSAGAANDDSEYKLSTHMDSTSIYLTGTTTYDVSLPTTKASGAMYYDSLVIGSILNVPIYEGSQKNFTSANVIVEAWV